MVVACGAHTYIYSHTHTRHISASSSFVPQREYVYSLLILWPLVFGLQNPKYSSISIYYFRSFTAPCLPWEWRPPAHIALPRGGGGRAPRAIRPSSTLSARARTTG